MPLNPIQMLEKLINERGSSAILKERLALASDQFAVTESKLATATQEVARLEFRVKDLELKNQDLQVHVAKQDEQIKVLKARIKLLEEKPVHESLCENEELLLAHLAQHQQQKLEVITKATGLGPQTAKMHLDRLEQLGLVESNAAYIDEYWRLTTKGRERMFEMGLLN